MKFKNLNLLLICLLLLNHCVYAQPTMVEQLRELHKKKSQGLITEQEFEQQKNKITESNSPAAKKEAEKKRQEQILAEKLRLETEKKRAEVKLIEEKEYGVKFPLHAAIKNSDIQRVKQLLAENPNLVINQFDTEGNTPWDVALTYKQLESITELLTTFKKINSPLAINVQVGINYQIGGFQATVNETLALQKKIKERNPEALKYLTELGETISATKSHVQRGLEASWAEATNKMLVLTLKTQPVLQLVKTDITGKAVFQNIPPGEYIVVGCTSTRSGLATWFVEVEVTTTSPNLFLDEKNAIIIF